MVVCHKDGNAENNQVSNLRIDTQKSNCADTKSHNRNLMGERHHQAILRECDVLEIRRLLSAGIAGVAIAKRFGVSKDAVYDIKHYRSWSHLQ